VTRLWRYHNPNTSLTGDVGELVALTLQLTHLNQGSTNVSGSVEPLKALTQLTNLRHSVQHEDGLFASGG
jgi:hypothetical protein